MTYSSSCHHHFRHTLLQQTMPNPGSPGKWPIKRTERDSYYVLVVSTCQVIGLKESSVDAFML